MDIQRSGRRLIAGRQVRWDDARAAEAYAHGLWTRTTLADALVQAATDTPGRTLLIEGDRHIDCAALHRDATIMAQALLARAKPGDVVSFMLPNWAEAAVIYLGATLAGMVANPILPSLRDRDLRYILPDVRSRIVFIPERIRNHDYSAMLERVCDGMPSAPEIVVVRGDAGPHRHYADLMAERHDLPLPEWQADAVQMVLYTSGTTGKPKGVMHSHNSIGALVRQLGRNWLVEPGDTFLVPSPISHIGGSIYAFELPLLLGTTAVLMDRWDGNDGLRLLESHRCTHMAGATPFLEQLLAAMRKADTRLPHFKLFICGGAAVSPGLINDAAGQFDQAIVTRVYGSTEVPLTTVGVISPRDPVHAAQTDGRPDIADIKLVPYPGARDGEGEIHARGPQMLVGYLHAEDEEAAFDADGYFRTGDLGRWVDEDFIVISGRAKDIIIRNGENISPKEIEDLLLGHPHVSEIAIVGIPDPRTGERACAVIVPHGDSRPDVQTIGEFLKENGAAPFKLPESVFLWPTLPKTATGKILKHEIRVTLIAAQQEQ